MAVATPSQAGHVVFTQAQGIAWVTLSHPGRMNALTIRMWRELADVFAQIARNEDVRCVGIRGAEGHFAAGADIREFPEHRADRRSTMAYHQDVIAPALAAVAACTRPVVAAICGVCVGGGLEIASQCDLRVASAEARFGVPINRLGFPMAPEEMRGLLALAGPAVTLEILLEGRVFGAAEAQAKGLLTRIVDADAFDAHVQALMQRLSRGAPLAARINKEAVRRLSRSSAPFDQDELVHFFRYAETHDHHEGVRAFLSGRAPEFTGE